jgi:hypothetical protein
MSGIGASQPTGTGQERPPQIPLFDPDGLPWTARLSLGWIIFLCFITGCLVAVPIGVYLGLWLMRRGCTASVLVIYSVVACSCGALLLLPDSLFSPNVMDAVALSVTVLWFVGAFLARQQIQQLYKRREGSEFHLSLPLTAFFTVLYLNYRIRAEFPTQTQSFLPR